MKINPQLTHPQAILDVCDSLLLDEYSQSYNKNVLALRNFINGSELGLRFWSKKRASFHDKKKCSTQLHKPFWSEAMCLCKKNIHI